METGIRRATSTLALTLVAAVGCFADLDHIPTAEVTDSAGVRVMDYDLSGVVVPTYRVVGDHDLEIGALEGAPEYAFSEIEDLALASDGSLLVSDGQARELRVFDADGRYLRTLGRAGRGPGEFAAAPVVAGLAGDTAFLFDALNGRLNAFLLDGTMLDLVTLQAESLGRPEALVRVADGALLLSTPWTPPSDVAEFHELRLELDSIVVSRLDGAGVLIDTVQVIADRSRARTVQDAGDGRMRVLQINTPLSARAFVVASGARPVIGRSDTFSLRFHPPTGVEAGRAVLRVRGVEHPASADEIRAWQEAELRAELGDGELSAPVRRVNLDFLPERLPAFGDVIVSSVGELWVSLTEFDLTEGLDWLVFSEAGELRGKVRTPPRLHVRAIGEDALVGFVLDELDVPYVRRYPLTLGVQGRSE